MIDAKYKAVMPGLIDAHIHTGDALIRGVAQDMHNWMQQGIWPFEEVLRRDEDAVQKGSMLNILEAVKAGTTTFCDFDTPMTRLVQNYVTIGARARVAELISELPEKSETAVGELYRFDPAQGEKKFKRNLDLIEQWHGRENGRITCMLGPQGADMCSKELLLEIRDAARRLDTGIHMHVCQGDREVGQIRQRYGMRPIPFLDSLGYLDERLMAVHLTEATDEETKLVAAARRRHGAVQRQHRHHRRHRPAAAQFLSVSERLALGSDQAPGNNCNNMFNEMKFTAILNKCKARDPAVFPAWKVLRMATIEAGARHRARRRDRVDRNGQESRSDRHRSHAAVPDAGHPGAGAQHRAQSRLFGKGQRSGDGAGGRARAGRGFPRFDRG